MKKDYKGMTSDEIWSEIEGLRQKHDKYEKRELGFLKAHVAALAFACGAFLLIASGAIYSAIVQSKLDSKNQTQIAEYRDAKLEDLTRRFESNEITLNEFETLKDLVEQTHATEYYTAVAPDQVKEEYQKFSNTRENIADSSLIGFSAAAGLSAISLMAVSLCKAKQNKVELENDAATQAWQSARFSEFLASLSDDDAEKPVFPLDYVEEDENEDSDEKTK